MRLGDFTDEEIRVLYGQHTRETGQVFTDEAIARAVEVTAGQPWLVNALAYEIVEEMAVPPDQPITADHIDAAKERLIIARATHLDSLLAKLHEPRVRRVMAPMIAGTMLPFDEAIDDDVSYVRDLGLIARDLPVRMANPIYREVILRVLGTTAATMVTASPRSFVTADRRLDFDKLLHEFAGFWREHAAALVKDGAYHEAAPRRGSDDARRRIIACTDLDQLGAWLTRALKVSSTKELFDQAER